MRVPNEGPLLCHEERSSVTCVENTARTRNEDGNRKSSNGKKHNGYRKYLVVAEN